MKISIVAAVAALSVFGIASTASAQCGPSLNVSAGNMSSMTDGFMGSAGIGNDSSAMNFMVGINFNLDGGRACALADENLANARDQRLRAAHTAALQEQQLQAATIDSVIKTVMFCESANLAIPAVAELCVGYTEN